MAHGTRLSWNETQKYSEFRHVGFVSFYHQKKGNFPSCGEHKDDCLAVIRSSLSRSTSFYFSTVVRLCDDIGFLGSDRTSPADLGRSALVFSVQTFHKSVGSCDDFCAVTRGSREVCGVARGPVLVCCCWDPLCWSCLEDWRQMY